MAGDGDARFADGEPDRPLRLAAEGAADLPVLAALLQDAAGLVGEAAYLARKRRFVALLNRFRWEDKPAAERAGRPYQRVRSALAVEGVLAARFRGLRRDDRDAAYSLLDIAFDPGGDGAGTLRLVLAGGGEIALSVETVDVALSDLSRPWIARAAPSHPDDAA